MKICPNWRLLYCKQARRPLRQPMTAKTPERLTRGSQLNIGPAIEYRNGKGLEDVLPAAPALEIDQIIGAHDPDKAMARMAAAETLDGVGGVLALPTLFAIAHPNRRMAREAPRCGQTLFERRHAALRFKRVLQRHQPPEFIQTEPLDSLEADMKVAFMCRIERAAEQPDAQTAGRRDHHHRHRVGTRCRAL